METPFRHVFCQGAPAASVVRAHLHVVKAGQVSVDVDRVYGAHAPTTELATRFAKIEDDDTLLVGLAPSGAVVGRGWGAHDDKVEIDGLPTMSEGEAATLLMSPSCASDLAALGEKGQHPQEARASSTHGCACNMHASSFDAGSAALVVATSIVAARLLRRG
ncbi:MAG TPA: hypothetical protein VIF62_19680 [Labilithrix sp.]|jgi:hypothetical protein